VLFQAFCSRSGASHAVFRLIRDGHLRLALSVPVFEEYRAVLTRPQNMELMNLAADQLDTVLRFVAFVSSPRRVYYL
jgi:predicted nucleic acid-binding protein